MPVTGGTAHRGTYLGEFRFVQRERQLRHADGRDAHHLVLTITSDSTITGAVKGNRGTSW